MTEVALFGAGRIGKIHAGNVARQAGVKLRYVVDVDDRVLHGDSHAANPLPARGARKHGSHVMPSASIRAPGHS